MEKHSKIRTFFEAKEESNETPEKLETSVSGFFFFKKTVSANAGVNACVIDKGIGIGIGAVIVRIIIIQRPLKRAAGVAEMIMYRALSKIGIVEDPFAQDIICFMTNAGMSWVCT